MIAGSDPVVIALPDGAAATVVQTDGARAVVLCTVPFPPGATLAGPGADGLGTYQLKVRGCRREAGAAGVPAESPRFRIDGRWVNLSRAQRDRLLSTAPDPPR